MGRYSRHRAHVRRRNPGTRPGDAVPNTHRLVYPHPDAYAVSAGSDGHRYPHPDADAVSAGSDEHRYPHPDADLHSRARDTTPAVYADT